MAVITDGTVESYSVLFDLSTDKIGFAFQAIIGRSGEASFTIDPDAFDDSSSDHVSKYMFHGDEGPNNSIDDIDDINLPWSNYRNLATSLEILMEELATAESWASNSFTVAFDTTSGKYTLSGATTFTITFNSQNSANLLGFSDLTLTGASSYESSFPCSYCIVPSFNGRSQWSREYEPGNISSLAISDSAKVQVGVGRTTVPKYMDWEQVSESYIRVFTDDATTHTYFTWQQFFEHCRQTKPFVVNTTDGDGIECHMFRSDGSNFKPIPIDTNNHEYWLIRFRTIFMGRA